MFQLLLMLILIQWLLLLGLLWLITKTKRSDGKGLQKLLTFAKQRHELSTIRDQFIRQIQSWKLDMKMEKVLVGTILTVTLSTLVMLMSGTVKFHFLLLIVLVVPCPILMGLIDKWQAVVVERIDQILEKSNIT
jgi:hypothetical protein